MNYRITFLDEERQADEPDLEPQYTFVARSDNKAKELANHYSTRPYELMRLAGNLEATGFVIDEANMD